MFVRRTAAGVAAAALTAAVWYGPLAVAANSSFAGHMTRHMLLVTAIPVLWVIAASGTRVDPAVRAPRLCSPLVASLVDLVVVWTWHLPAWHHAARVRPEVALAEQATFLAAGLWLWTAILAGAPMRRRAMAGESLVALVLTFAHMTMLGAMLALAPRALFEHGPAGSALVALADQQLGGTIMLAASAAAYVSAGVWLAQHLLHGRPGREVLS